jgi:hypothetical protein
MPAIVNAANCTVAASTGGVFVVTKTGGDPSAADASAVSDQAMSGDFVLRARTLGNFFGYFGVSANPLAGNGSGTIDRAVQINGTSGRCYESGLFRPPLFSPGTGFVWMRRADGTLDWLYGPELSGATLVRSVAGVAGTLWFDSSILRPDVGLEVKFGAPADFALRKPRRRLTLAIGY